MFVGSTEKADRVFGQYHLNHHCFADNTQAYIDIPPSEDAAVTTQLQNCVADVADWCGTQLGLAQQYHFSQCYHPSEVLLSARTPSHQQTCPRPRCAV